MVRNWLFRSLFGIVGILASLRSVAQNDVEMADSFRSNGKIYIVVAVCLTILIGLFLYVMRVERKISRLEKRGIE